MIEDNQRIFDDLFLFTEALLHAFNLILTSKYPFNFKTTFQNRLTLI